MRTTTVGKSAVLLLAGLGVFSTTLNPVAAQTLPPIPPPPVRTPSVTPPSAQKPQSVIPQATATARVEQREKQDRQVLPENYDLNRYPVTDANERYWRNLLWTAAVREPQAEFVPQTIAAIMALSSRNNLSAAQGRTVNMALQVGTQLYLSNPSRYANLGEQFQQIIQKSTDPIRVAMAFSALTQAGMEPQQRQQWAELIRQRFPKWAENVQLLTTLRDASFQDRPPPLPPLTDLFAWRIAPEQLHLYVVCQPDRGVLCQSYLKDAQGRFVRQGEQLWSVPLLLRSIHGLAWNFYRGQTPQGIYRIEGEVPQPDTEYFRAYGFFALVNLFVPFEPGVKSFIPGQKGQLSPSLTAYQALLPPSWRNYYPIQQTYWAGKGGRSLFRIHGSGEAPSFFSNNSRFPQSGNWNPTIGCLSALELYDETGQLQQADMPTILNALTAAAGTPKFTGYLIVVEVPPGTDVTAAIPTSAPTAVGQQAIP